MGCKRTNRTACSGKMGYRATDTYQKHSKKEFGHSMSKMQRKRDAEMTESFGARAHGDSEFATNKRVIKQDHLRSPTVIIGPYAMAPIAIPVKFKYVLPFCQQFVETFAGQTEIVRTAAFDVS